MRAARVPVGVLRAGVSHRRKVRPARTTFPAGVLPGQGAAAGREGVRGVSEGGEGRSPEEGPPGVSLQR